MNLTPEPRGRGRVKRLGWLALAIPIVLGYYAIGRIKTHAYAQGQADAVLYAEYRGLATFDSALAAAGATAVWLESPRRVAFYSVRVCKSQNLDSLP